MLRICLEEDVCLYRPNARWGGEFEWLKTLQGSQLRIAEYSWVSGVRRNIRKNCPKQSLHHHMLFGRVSRKILLAPPKQTTPANSVVRHDCNFNGTGFYAQMKLKMSFLAANTQDGFGATGIKKYPCVKWNILLYFLCCGPIFLLEVLNILFRHKASWIL